MTATQKIYLLRFIIYCGLERIQDLDFHPRYGVWVVRSLSVNWKSVLFVV